MAGYSEDVGVGGVFAPIEGVADVYEDREPACELDEDPRELPGGEPVLDEYVVCE